MPKKVYAVRAGRACGIFTTWDECKKQVDGYAGARYKGFTDVAEALAWLNGGDRPAAPQRSSAVPRRAPRPHPARETASAIPDSEQDYVIYTDGSCLRNPDGPGGWAAVVTNVRTGEVTELHEGNPSTTNNRMELSAAIAAMSFPDAPSKIAIYTDSQYLKNGFTKGWLKSWKSRGWKKADGNPVLNQDLWMQLDVLYQKHQITFHWVKGHVGIDLNERCDQLAKSEAMKYQ
ncbi:ribonuclease HI [Selenomonas sp. WCT3]|uniref:ribonuclease HI n=1 Tax=Selenomonas sp. WCT3 TaxID=3158785 RepID=UPI0008855E81|nr:ribonuclease HI [Selenomonas ruminantium]